MVISWSSRILSHLCPKFCSNCSSTVWSHQERCPRKVEMFKNKLFRRSNVMLVFIQCCVCLICQSHSFYRPMLLGKDLEQFCYKKLKELSIQWRLPARNCCHAREIIQRLRGKCSLSFGECRSSRIIWWEHTFSSKLIITLCSIWIGRNTKTATSCAGLYCFNHITSLFMPLQAQRTWVLISWADMFEFHLSGVVCK